MEVDTSYKNKTCVSGHLRIITNGEKWEKQKWSQSVLRYYLAMLWRHQQHHRRNTKLSQAMIKIVKAKASDHQYCLH
jgi:hypothetical protein